MHAEALIWRGISVSEYALALRISHFGLRKWRNLIADEDIVIEWHAQLHGSARPQISSGVSGVDKLDTFT